MATMTRYEAQLQHAREKFESDTAEHSLAVLHDEGLYRHLRCQKPGTWIYGFDVVTWPGYLSIVGDAGDYLFTRVRDMFEFFEDESGRINPQYWGEKLRGPGSETEYVYSEQALRQRLDEWIDSVGTYGEVDLGDLRREVHAQILSHDLYDEDNARRALSAFEFSGHQIEHWEWRLRDFDARFLWCCHGIVWAINEYRNLSR